MTRRVQWEPSFSCHNVPNVPPWAALGPFREHLEHCKVLNVPSPPSFPSILYFTIPILYYYTLYFALNYRKILYTRYNYTLPGTFDRSAGTFGTFMGTFGTFAGTFRTCAGTFRTFRGIFGAFECSECSRTGLFSRKQDLIMSKRRFP